MAEESRGRGVAGPPGVAARTEEIPDPIGAPEPEPAPPTGAQYDALLKAEHKIQNLLGTQPRGIGPDEVHMLRGWLTAITAARLDPETTTADVLQAYEAWLAVYEAAHPTPPEPKAQPKPTPQRGPEPAHR